MSLGLSLGLVGTPDVLRRFGRVAALTDSAAVRTLAQAGIETGNQVKRLMNMPQRRDPFWGVMGTDSPVGLGRRTGLTGDAVIATGTVYVGGEGQFYTFVAHPSPHVAQLEDGGTVTGKFWIPTAAAQTPAGADRWPGGGPEGSFVWPTAKMQNFAHGRPKNKWLVIAAPKTARGRSSAQRGGSRLRAAGPLPPTPGGLTFLKLFKPSVTYRPHRTFATARDLMAPRFAELGAQIFGEVLRAA